MKSKNIPALLLLLLVILVVIYLILSKCSGTKTLAVTCMNAYATMGTRTAAGSTSPTDSVPSQQQGTQLPVQTGAKDNLAVVHSTNDSSGGTVYCTGTGFCSTSLVQTSSDQVPVTICAPTDNPSAVTITFSMSALKQKQPDHVRYIENKTEYTFGADCIFTDTACKKLGYQLNTKIQGKKAGKIKINADTVVITMPVVKQ